MELLANTVPNDLDLGLSTALVSTFVLLFILFIILAIFWIRSLMHLLAHPDVPNRTIWILAHFIILQLLAGVVYYFVAQRHYKEQAYIVVGRDGLPPGKP